MAGWPTRQGTMASRTGRPHDLGGVRGGAAPASFPMPDFGGFHCIPASKACTVRFDNNKYSVLSSAVGRPVKIHAYADRIVIRQDGAVVGEHARCFGPNEVTYDPWHYVPVPARKPGGLRNGAPCKYWVLPSAMEKVRRKLKASDDGDRQMLSILTCVLSDGLNAVEAACQEALDHVSSATVILNILAAVIRHQARSFPSHRR